MTGPAFWRHSHFQHLFWIKDYCGYFRPHCFFKDAETHNATIGKPPFPHFGSVGSASIDYFYYANLDQNGNMSTDLCSVAQHWQQGEVQVSSFPVHCVRWCTSCCRNIVCKAVLHGECQSCKFDGFLIGRWKPIFVTWDHRHPVLT